MRGFSVLNQGSLSQIKFLFNKTELLIYDYALLTYSYQLNHQWILLYSS